MASSVKTEEVFRLSDRVNRIAASPTMMVVQAADQLKSKGVDVADFGAGEPDFPTPDHIKRAAIKALEENRTKYTPVPGNRSAAPGDLRLACEGAWLLVSIRRVRGDGRRKAGDLQRDLLAD